MLQYCRPGDMRNLHAESCKLMSSSPQHITDHGVRLAEKIFNLPDVVKETYRDTHGVSSAASEHHHKNESTTDHEQTSHVGGGCSVIASSACAPQPSPAERDRNTGSQQEGVAGDGKAAAAASSPPVPTVADAAADSCSAFQKTMALVKQSGFYHGSLTMVGAKRLLKRASVGSFLLRDSSVSDFVLSLSVKTARGTTSLRIHFKNGAFLFDCLDTAQSALPSFPCILNLIEHYVECSRTNRQRCMFLESSGRKDTPVLLLKPFMTRPQDLKHLARVRLNQLLSEENKRRLLLFMKPEIETFLLEYPCKV